jgi:hypothetical protein
MYSSVLFSSFIFHVRCSVVVESQNKKEMFGCSLQAESLEKIGEK